MKKNKYLIAGALWATLGTGEAFAMELWEPHLPALDVGLPAGVLPKEGVYGVVNTYWASATKHDNSGHKTGVKLDALIVVPTLLWSTGAKVLGADYAVAISQPIDYTNVKVRGDSTLSNNGHWGSFNTVLVPALLSWKTSSDLHVKTGLLYLVNNASSSPAHQPANRGVGSGNGYSTWMPELGISWLNDGWNLSADAYYSFNNKNGTTGYRTGQALEVDYTASKTVGKWTVGLGGFQVHQLTKDTGALPADCASSGCKVRRFGLGPMVGYNFGSATLSAQYHHDVYTKNAMGGNIFNVRLVVAF